MQMGGYVEYDSNNSGGRWWLTDEDWKALEAAGWKVQWHWFSVDYDKTSSERIGDDGMPVLVRKPESGGKFSWDNAKEGDRFLGALAAKAYRAGLSLRDAADEWERITHGNATDPGCPCCGKPHSFTEYDAEGSYVRSGPETSYSASW
jgi:hypothetical protein